ncbi:MULTISPECIES: DUF6526 family protein [unclassified Paenibacillus]|uniref:DUF6526 family protein n=1 Tax=unclassified Paenibacillus TaxID=185978 RepID=UPI001AEB8111|nr:MULTISPECIES: DUF6526 family protein [unclassified Paenibacillus]MBP1156923.1 hypothetical protein [Paenibacillus sp. PvP091]MBP1172338.1 hypothetical protein [Paenibacillus sp. PvR098]MBP2438719.1 hypothetical protein [Paenibacillus sp. PvP052]
MDQQNYGNHRKLDPLYHYGLSLLTMLVLIGSGISLFGALSGGEDAGASWLLLGISAALLLLFIKVRGYALKAQDRAIRAEEQLRHYILTGKPIDPKLTLKQIIALRFAGDEEYPDLCRKAVEESMKPDDIKKAIRHWRADYDRL